MPKTLVLDKSAEQGLKDLLRSLLTSGKVKGVLTLRRIGGDGSVAFSLVTDPEKLEEAVPFLPSMPANAGRLVSQFTMTGGAKEPVAVVLRPCELRAFTELVKFEKGSMDNLLLIGLTCGGVYPIKNLVGGNTDELKRYWDDVKGGRITGGIRPACKGCEHFEPYNADMVVRLVGRGDLDKACTISLVTEKGEAMAEGAGGKVLDMELDDLSSYREKRTKEKERLFEEHGIGPGIDGLLKTYGGCIGCKGCRSVCPICFCQLCTFDLQDSGYRPSRWEVDVKVKGGTRVPPDTIYYHLGRLTHVALSCVGCGQCEDVCPADIPLAIIYKKTGEELQRMFDYLSGRDIEEKLPLKTYEIQELSEVEN